MNRYLLPPYFRMWSDAGEHVFFDPTNFVFVKVNDTGKHLLDLLDDTYSLDKVTKVACAAYHIQEGETRDIITNFFDRLVTAGFVHVNEYRVTRTLVFSPMEFPGDVYLHLTNKCNLKCPYCYNKTDRTTKIKLERAGLVAPTMSTEEVTGLIRDLVRNGVKKILFTGGEPLLRDDIQELVIYARGQSREHTSNTGQAVLLEMLTNGIRITDEVAEFMCRYLDRVTISLDGHERHLHEEERGSGTFGPTIDGIRRLVATKRRLQSQTPLLSLVPALTDRNIDFMKEIYEFALDDLGADHLAPIFFQAGDHQELSIQRIPSLPAILEAHKRTDDYLRMRTPKDASDTNESSPLSPRNHCGVGNGEISIDPGGFVYPCQTLHFDEFICGNVRDTDIAEIVHESPVMKRVRGTTSDTIKVCSHCDVRHICNGGCRATAYNIYREFDHHNEIYCKTLESMAIRTLHKSDYVSPGQSIA